jgi:hypothetical protein
MFSKEIFTLWDILRSLVAGLSAYFLGNQGGKDAMLLSVLANFQNLASMQHSKW